MLISLLPIQLLQNLRRIAIRSHSIGLHSASVFLVDFIEVLCLIDGGVGLGGGHFSSCFPYSY